MSANEIQVSSLPLPPTQYINLYTDENIRRNRVPRPPPPPGPHDSYSTFGIAYNNEEIIRSLESQNIKRLVPVHCDRRKELKKLNHSLFVNFLDLLDFLILNPDSPRRTEKVEDLNVLFINLHHCINEFRPHQARETLRVMMELQKRQRCDVILRFNKHYEKVREIVNNAFQALPNLANEEYATEMSIENNAEEINEVLKNDPEYQNDRTLCSLVDEID